MTELLVGLDKPGLPASSTPRSRTCNAPLVSGKVRLESHAFQQNGREHRRALPANARQPARPSGTTRRTEIVP